MTPPTFVLRPAEHPQDYPQIAALLSQVWPEPVTAAIMAKWMQRKPEGQIEVWQVAVAPTGALVGYAEVIRQPWKPAGDLWRWVVVDAAWRNQGIGQMLYAETKSMFNFMTGVDKAYRGRRLALALKLLTIRFAKAYGATYIRTGNDSENAPMLAINRHLGYEPLPGAYQLTNHLTVRSS